MSAASIRLLNSLPTDGALGLPVGTEINSITPLGIGDLVLRPSSPGDGAATETIEITTELVGVSFPGIGMTRLEAGTTAFPLLIVIASRGSLPHQITLRSSAGGGGGGSATAANQVLGLNALDSIYDALTLVGTEATSTQILSVLTALKGTSTLDDLADGLTAISGGASQADIKTALETQGVDIGLTLAAVNTLVTNTDGIETLLAAIQVGTDRIPASPAQDRTAAAAPSATRASNGTAFIDLALEATVAAVKGAVDAAKAVLDTIYTRLADGNQIAIAKGPIAPGAAVGSEKPVLTGGSDGTNARTFFTDTAGRLATTLATLAKGATAAGNPTSTAIDANTQALDISIKGVPQVYPIGATAAGGAAITTGPMVIGAVDSNGKPYHVVGELVGSYLHIYVKATNNVAVTAPSGSALALDATLTNGNQRTKADGASPTADATTGVYTRFPALGTASVTFTSGVAAMKASSGRVRRIKIRYSGATGSGLYVQLHAAATGTTPSDATLIDFWPIDAVSPILEVDSSIDLPCANGIKFAFSTTPDTYTAAIGESGFAIAWGA